MSLRERSHTRNQLTKFFLASFLLVLAVSVENVRPEDFGYGSESAALAKNCQLDNILQSLLTPDELASIHVQALRQELLRILNNEALTENLDFPVYDEFSDDATYEDKRSIASLAKSGQLPYEYKRNLGSLARSGYFRNNPFNKRSIATLAKNGMLPTLQAPEEDLEVEEQKRGIESLARSGAMNRYLARSGYLNGKRYNNDNNYEDKRNLGSLARNGYLKRDIDNFLENLNQKRYLGSLVRQYNFPGGKRNLGSLARNGELSRFARNNFDESLDSDKRNVQSLMRSGGMMYGGKRNLASLMRAQNAPFVSRYNEYKRNIGAMARDWALPNHSSTNYEKNEEDKRNVAALLRQDSYFNSMNRNSAVGARPTADMDDGMQSEEKRNIASLKAQATSSYNNYGNRNIKRSISVSEGGDKLANVQSAKDESDNEHVRSKRQIDDFYAPNSEEYSVPVMQNSNSYDYEDLVNALTGNYPSNEKRFLGSVARGGWYRGGAGGQVRFNPIKRHIGSLARLGWLPSFRYARSRFGRSGRSVLPPLERKHSTLTDGRIRQAVLDGAVENIEYDTDEPYIPQTPISSIQDTFRKQRLDKTDDTESNDGQNIFKNHRYPFSIAQHSDNPNVIVEDDPDDYYPPLESSSDKRYLLLPAVDNILLRRLYPSHTTKSKES